MFGAGYQNDFYADFWPLAQQAGAATGIDPAIVFGQAALESNWGRSAPGNNFFGIKGGGQFLQTQEHAHGQFVDTYAGFESYSSPADSVAGYVQLMSGDRYEAVRNAPDFTTQVQALGASGYATDPAYADKVASIAAPIYQSEGGRGWLNKLRGLDSWLEESGVVGFLDRLTDPLPGDEFLEGVIGGVGTAGEFVRGSDQPGEVNTDRLQGWVVRGTYIGLGVILVTVGLILIGVVQRDFVLRIADQ